MSSGDCGVSFAKRLRRSSGSSTIQLRIASTAVRSLRGISSSSLSHDASTRSEVRAGRWSHWLPNSMSALLGCKRDSATFDSQSGDTQGPALIASDERRNAGCSVMAAASSHRCAGAIRVDTLRVQLLRSLQPAGRACDDARRHDRNQGAHGPCGRTVQLDSRGRPD
jgi:hypothetical protein